MTDALIPRPRTTTAATADTTPGAVVGWRFLAEDPSLDPVAETLDALFAADQPAAARGAAATVTLRLGDPGGAPAPIGLDPTGHSVDERYLLRPAHGGGAVDCIGGTAEALFRGGVSAGQLLATGGAGRGQSVQLSDGPRHTWRGLTVDLARGFPPFPDLLRLVDLAALYKLNVLHLHLTDNEGWRLEVPGFPGLTPPVRPGAARDFLTAAEYRALQDHAARRFVTVLPEIDLPGHCAALLARLPGLRGVPRPDGWPAGVPFAPPLDLADPDTAETVDRILGAVCAATDGPFVHIGGDEAAGVGAAAFAESVRCLLTSVRRHGKRPVGWQEASRAGLGPADVVQYWVDVPMMDLPDAEEELAARDDLLAAGMTARQIALMKRFFAPTDGDLPRALEAGARVLLSPQSHVYLDRPYDPAVVPTDQAEQAARLGFPGYRPRGVRYAAGWDPAECGVPEAGVAGVQATLFGASCADLGSLTLMALPRLAGFAEVAWSGTPAPWGEYRERLARHAPLWRARGLGYLATTEVDWR